MLLIQHAIVIGQVIKSSEDRRNHGAYSCNNWSYHWIYPFVIPLHFAWEKSKGLPKWALQPKTCTQWTESNVKVFKIHRLLHSVQLLKLINIVIHTLGRSIHTRTKQNWPCVHRVKYMQTVQHIYQPWLLAQLLLWPGISIGDIKNVTQDEKEDGCVCDEEALILNHVLASPQTTQLGMNHIIATRVTLHVTYAGYTWNYGKI